MQEEDFTENYVPDKERPSEQENTPEAESGQETKNVFDYAIERAIAIRKKYSINPTDEPPSITGNIPPGDSL